MRPLSDAVREHVHDGAVVYIGNFGSQLFAVAHEMIRQGATGVNLVVSSGGILMDQLMGAGVLRSATFAHCWSPVGPAPTHNFRREAQDGDGTCRLRELSLGSLSAGLMAAAWGLPFMPVPGLDETGYVTSDWSDGLISRAQSPLGDVNIVAAIRPTVAFVHADLADEAGNAAIRGPVGEALVATQAAETTVVVAEEIVPSHRWREVRVTVPSVLVSSVVHYPGAVAPDGAAGRYERDVEAYRRYSDLAATASGFARWMEDDVHGGR